MFSKMPDMQKMMSYGQNLYGLGQMGYQTFCAYQPQNPQCQSGAMGYQFMSPQGQFGQMLTP